MTDIHLWDGEDGIFEEEETDWHTKPVPGPLPDVFYRAVCGFRTTNLGNEQVIYDQSAFDEFGYELTCMGCILLTFQEKMNDGQV